MARIAGLEVAEVNGGYSGASAATSREMLVVLRHSG